VSVGALSTISFILVSVMFYMQMLVSTMVTVCTMNAIYRFPAASNYGFRSVPWINSNSFSLTLLTDCSLQQIFAVLWGARKEFWNIILTSNGDVVCSSYVKGMFQVCSRYVKGMFQVCKRFLKFIRIIFVTGYTTGNVCVHNVTFRRDLATTVQWKGNKYYVFGVFCL
jgi:hypothetical protein